ncbi:MAG: class I SAM-dependent methyltransferase [Planctomycetota bacterium]|jgi:SAM-dependent methyltransferase
MAIKTLIKDLLGVGADAPRAVGRCVHHAGLRLPPAALRRCTIEFKEDAFFVETATREARRLIEHCDLTVKSRVLDIGCGPARLPLGLLGELGSIERYEGIDVDRHAIAWCRRWITSSHREFRFTHLDIHNERYNPGGRIRLDDRFRFDFADGSFDVIYLYSVFTHMEAGDISIYLAELRRLLAPDGRVFLTAYLEDDVPDVSVNPPSYRGHSNTPLHRVRLNRRYFDDLLSAHGLTMVRLDPGREHDGQSGVYLERTAR